MPVPDHKMPRISSSLSQAKAKEENREYKSLPSDLLQNPSSMASS